MPAKEKPKPASESTYIDRIALISIPYVAGIVAVSHGLNNHNHVETYVGAAVVLSSTGMIVFNGWRVKRLKDMKRG